MSYEWLCHVPRQSHSNSKQSTGVNLVLEAQVKLKAGTVSSTYQDSFIDLLIVGNVISFVLSSLFIALKHIEAFIFRFLL